MNVLIRHSKYDGSTMDSNASTIPTVGQLLLQLHETLKQIQPSQHQEPLKRSTSVGTDPSVKKPWVPGGVSVRSKANKADAAATVTPSSSPPGPCAHGEGSQTPVNSTFSVSNSPRRISSSPRRSSRPQAAPPAGPARNPSPAPGCSGARSTQHRSTVSTAGGVSRRDARACTADSSECAGLPYHEALQLAYGPPASPTHAAHADCVAVVAKKASHTAKQQPFVYQGTSSSNGSGSRPMLPSCRSSKTRRCSVTAAAGVEAFSATSAAVAAALGVVVASAVLAKGGRPAAGPQHSAAEQQELLEVLKGYTSGYIDGRLAALKGSGTSRKSSITDGGELPAMPLPPQLATQAATDSSCIAAGSRQLVSPAQHPASTAVTAGSSLDGGGGSAGALLMPCAVASPTSSGLAVESAMVPAQTIRPELVKRIALRIVSAALAGPDTASTTCTTHAAADAACAQLPSSPRQQRRQAQPEQAQPPQLPQPLQRPYSPGPAVLQGHESMQEFSVSAFDHETAAYLIPVSHIGCQTSEVFSPVLPAGSGGPQQQQLTSCSSLPRAGHARMQLYRSSTLSSSLDVEAPQPQQHQPHQQDTQHVAACEQSGRIASSVQVGMQQQQQLQLCEPKEQPDEQQSLRHTGLPAAAVAAVQGVPVSHGARSLSQIEQLLDMIQARAKHKLTAGRQVQELQEPQEPQSPLSPHTASGLARQVEDRVDPYGAVSREQGQHLQLLPPVEQKQPPQHQQQPQQQQQVAQAQGGLQELLVSSDQALAVTCVSVEPSSQVSASPVPGSRLELVMSELSMLQSAVRDHGAVDQLALSRLDELTAEVARLHRVLEERRLSPQPTSPQPLRGDLSTWTAQAAGHDDPTQQALHSMPMCPGSSWCSSSPQPDAAVYTSRLYESAASGAFAPAVSQAALMARAGQHHPASPRRASSPEQQVLAPILSAGLLRRRTVSGPLGATWPAELPPVLEGRESDGKDSDCSSTQKPPASKASPQHSRSTDTGGAPDACTPSGSAQQDKKQVEGFSLLRHGWLSPRSRSGSLAVPAPVSPRSKASSFDCLRSPASPTSSSALVAVYCSDGEALPAELQLHAAMAASAGCPGSSYSSQRWPALSPRGGATGGVGMHGGGGSPSSAEKKRGFMLALKQSLKDNMQQLGSRRGSPGRLGKGGS